MSINSNHQIIQGIKVITDLAKRIIDLSNCFSSDKEFLETCEINNRSLLTDLRRGRLKQPGAGILADIVRGTGCSGKWLLTGEGEMFPPQQPDEQAAADEELQKDIMRALMLIERIEQKQETLKRIALPEDLALKFSRLANRLLEFQLESRNNQDA